MCTAGSSFVATIRTSPPAVSLAESQLSGGDFLCDIDYCRTDDAGSSLRAVLRPLASTTLAYLVRRFGDKQLAGVENAVGFLVRRSVQVLAEKARAGQFASCPTIDLDPTGVEVYGKQKRGVAFNYPGQRCGRPHPAIWAEAGLVLAADLGSPGTDDPWLEAPSLIDRAPGALPEGLEAPIFRGDSLKRRIASFFMSHLALLYSHSNKGCVSHARWASTNRRFELTGHHRRSL